MKRIQTLTLCCAMAATLCAQVTADSYRLSDHRQLWHQTRNAAGMTFDFATADTTGTTLPHTQGATATPHAQGENRGVAYFDFLHEEGDYHRVQDGGQRNTLRFFTERYQKIGRYLYGYGSFDFNMGRTKERAWSDVLRSYNANPYISGSSVFGKYDHQDFALNASLSTVQLGRFTYGASVRYNVGDLSRLRDPRSRINLLDYRLMPAVTYQLAKSQSASSRLGLALHYDRRKEKLPSLTTVQTDPNLKYYVMTGLENATGTTGGYQGYMREYVNHEVGGELSYGYQGTSLHSVTAATLDHGTEYVYGTNKYEPGRYYTYRYALATQNRLQCGGLLHSLDMGVGYLQAYADEYRQERLSETDGQTGYTSIRWNTTMEYRKRYQSKQLALNLHYRLTFTDGDRQRGYIGAAYELQDVSNKRLLPVSTLDYGASTVSLEGGLSLFGHRLLVDALAGYHMASKADLMLADATTDYAVGVLLPDMNILDADYFQGSLGLEYQQPVKTRRNSATAQRENGTLMFVRARGSYVSAQHSLNRSVVGLSIGLYY